MSTPASAVVRRQYVWLLAVLIVAGAAQLAGGLLLLARFDDQVDRLNAAQSSHALMLQAMPCSLSSSWKCSLGYWLPWSEW